MDTPKVRISRLIMVNMVSASYFFSFDVLGRLNVVVGFHPSHTLPAWLNLGRYGIVNIALSTTSSIPKTGISLLIRIL